MLHKNNKFIILPIILAVFFAVQLNTVSASEKVLSTLTSPLTYFKLGGKVMYDFHNKLFPLANVTVKVTDDKTHQTFSTVTSKNGTYEFLLTKDTYKVKPTEKYEFNFWTRMVSLMKNTTDINFTVHNKDKDGNK